LHRMWKIKLILIFKKQKIELKN